MINEEKLKQIPFLKVFKPMIKKVGLDAAVIIPELAFKQQTFKSQGKTNMKGFFFYEHSKMQEETGISEHRQKKAMDKLVEVGILEIDSEKKGTPPKTFYRVDIEKYHKMVEELYKSEPKKKKSIIYW